MIYKKIEEGYLDSFKYLKYYMDNINDNNIKNY